MSKKPEEKSEEQAAILDLKTLKMWYPIFNVLVTLVIPPDTPEKYREKFTHVTEVMDEEIKK